MPDKRNVFCFRTSLTLILHSNLLNLAGISFRGLSYLSFEIMKFNFVQLFGLIVKMSLSRLDVYIILYDLKPEIFLHV